MIHWPLKALTARTAYKYGDKTLTILLLVAAAVIVLIALFVHNPWVKAVVLAYVVLP